MTPLPLSVLTPDYLISGVVEDDAQKWAWTYFSVTEKNPPRALEITVSDARPTGGRAAPPLAGCTASFAFGTAIIALISTGAPTDALWDKWAALIGTPVAAELFAGPYAVTGQFLSADGTMSAILNDRIAVRDASFTRIDGAGDGVPIQAARAVVATGFVQTAVVAG
jgi:hypothetical protein